MFKLTQQAIKTTSDYDPEIYKPLENDISKALLYVQNIKTDAHQMTQDLAVLTKSMRDLEKEITSELASQLKNPGGNT